MAIYILVPSAFIFIIGAGILLSRNIHRSKIRYSFLELLPPLTNDKQLESIEMYYKVLHSLLRSTSLKIWAPVKRISFELVSDRAKGIRFITVVPVKYEQAYRSIIVSHLPEVKITETDDYIIEDSKNLHVDTYRLKRNFAYRLKESNGFGVVDNLAYISGAMTKLKSREVVSLQIVVSVGGRVMANRRLRIISRSYRQKISRGAVDPISQSRFESMVHKLQLPLLRTSIKSLVISPDIGEIERRRLLIRNVLSSFEGEKNQSLVRNRINLGNPKKHFSERRINAIQNLNNLFSREELSLLYHFPIRSSTDTENISRSLTHVLPAPVSLKGNGKLDVLLGVNHYHGTDTPIGLTAAERDKHVYVVGGTGNGKTTMLLYAIVQDIESGKGVAVIDPHGDLAEAVLRQIPRERLKDVIYMNPDDLSHPIGLNLLELPVGLQGDELLREKDLLTESTISVMRKVFSDDDSGGHRIEYILRNSIQTALTLDQPTLFTIFSLLNDVGFRSKVVRDLQDNDLKNFWINELGRAGSYQRVKMSAGITAKVGRFLFSSSAKRILEQPRSTVDFNEIMDSSKILVCNFSKGLIGEDTSTLFGTTVLAKLQMAALRRARLKQSERKPFYLYVDEFQNFATMSFVQMLSEARKYKLFLTMAEQSTTQQHYQRLVEVILANVGTIVCFRSGSQTDEKMLLPLFRPFIEEGSIPNLPSYNFYMRLAAVQPQEPLSGETVVLKEPSRDQEKMARRVKNFSRQTYGKPFSEKARGSSFSFDRAKGKTPQTSLLS